MKAIELRIVFEDDDGKMYVVTESGEKADKIVRAVAQTWEDLVGNFPGEPIGPVLRQVTEVEGRLVEREFHDDEARISFPREPNGIMRCRGIDEHLFPDGVAAKYDEEKDDYAGPLYRFRFDVTAVSVKP